jgi:hypothetical protein
MLQARCRPSAPKLKPLVWGPYSVKSRHSRNVGYWGTLRQLARCSDMSGAGVDRIGGGKG